MRTIKFGAKLLRLPAGDSQQGGPLRALESPGGFRQGQLGNNSSYETAAKACFIV